MLPKLVAQKIEENKTAMLQTLQDLIAIPSVATETPENGYPYGSNCAKALDSMLQTAASFGLHTNNLAYHVALLTQTPLLPPILVFWLIWMWFPSWQKTGTRHRLPL